MAFFFIVKRATACSGSGHRFESYIRPIDAVLPKKADFPLKRLQFLSDYDIKREKGGLFYDYLYCPVFAGDFIRVALGGLQQEPSLQTELDLPAEPEHPAYQFRLLCREKMDLLLYSSKQICR